MKKKRNDSREDVISVEELIEIRKKVFNISASKIAIAIGVSRQTINNIESKKITMTVPTSICIMLYLQKLINENPEKYNDEYKISKFHQDILNKIKSFKF